MKIILSELSVWWFRASCLIMGGAILIITSALSGNRIRLKKEEFRPIIVCGVFSILGWMIFSAYGVSLMPAGRASIIAFTMPLWASILAAWFLGETVTPAKILGLSLGIAGLITLIGQDIYLAGTAQVGAFYMLLAAISWAIGTILIKRGSWNISILSNVGWQLVFCSIPVTIIAILFEPIPDLETLSTKAWLALLYIYLFPMTFCQWAYFKTITLLPASVAAIGTLLVPVIGVYSSHFILGESVGFAEILALLLIISALALVMLLPNFGSNQKKTDPI
jgi:drug/metabolite transporter (DMT)-like permease